MEGVGPPKFVKPSKSFGEKIDSNLGKIWFGKVDQNPFWLLAYVVYILRLRRRGFIIHTFNAYQNKFGHFLKGYNIRKS